MDKGHSDLIHFLDPVKLIQELQRDGTGSMVQGDRITGIHFEVSGEVAKGDVLAVARLAGIMAAKKVGDLIPLTHPLAIDKADIDFTFNNSENSIQIQELLNFCFKKDYGFIRTHVLSINTSHTHKEENNRT